MLVFTDANAQEELNLEDPVGPQKDMSFTAHRLIATESTVSTVYALKFPSKLGSGSNLEFQQRGKRNDKTHFLVLRRCSMAI